MAKSVLPKGLIVPLLTPLNADGGLDIDMLKSHVDFLIEGGVHGLFPLGTAGEFALLSRDERLRVIKVVVERAAGKVPVYAGVADPGTDNVIDYAKAARDFGADAVVATSPYYYKTNEEGLLNHFRSIAEEAEIYLIIYNIPSWTYQSIPLSVAEKLAENELIIGMKYTTSDLYSFQKYVSVLGGKLSMLIGSDSLFYSALEFGADGAVLGGANVAPKIFAEIYNAYMRSDREASIKAQKRVLPIADIMELGTFPSSLKEAMEVIGKPLGGVRNPLMPLSNSNRVQVAESLRVVGLI